MLPARLGRLAEIARKRRARVAAVLPAAQRRAFWESVLHGPIAEMVFAGKDEDAQAAMDARLQRGPRPAREAGEVYLVATPPHDEPELLTLRALRLLQQADVVFVDPQLPQRVLDLIRRDAERRHADRGADTLGIIDALATFAAAGQRVCWFASPSTLAPAHGAAPAQIIATRGVSVLRA